MIPVKHEKYILFQVALLCLLSFHVHTGDIFIICLKKATSLLNLKLGSTCVTVPLVTRTEFALTPLSEVHNETDAAVKSWEGEDYCEMARGDVQAGEKVNGYLVLYVFWRTT